MNELSEEAREYKTCHEEVVRVKGTYKLEKKNTLQY